MGRTEFLTLTIRSEPRLESANQPRERNGALQQECMNSCAHTVIDTADIVRDGDFSTVIPLNRDTWIASEWRLFDQNLPNRLHHGCQPFRRPRRLNNYHLV